MFSLFSKIAGWQYFGMAKLIAIALLCVSIMVYIGSLKLRLGVAQGEVSKLQGEKSRIEAEYKTLSDLTKTQNEMVVSWKNAADLSAHKAAEAIEKSKDISKHIQPVIIKAKARAVASKELSCDQAVLDAIQDIKGMR